MDGAVFEVKNKPRSYSISPHGLQKITVGEEFSVEIAQREETVDQPFRMTHTNLRESWRSNEQCK